MANVACPTCGHFFGIRDDQKGLVLACPKCKLSFRALDSVVTEQRQDATKFAARTAPNGKLIAGGVAIVIGIIALVIVFNPASFLSGPTTTTSQQPTYSSEPTFTPAPVQTPAPVPTTTARVGSVNYSMIETFKDSWVKEGWRDKPKSERALAMTLMIAVVRNDIQDLADQEATLDYIQQTIGTW